MSEAAPWTARRILTELCDVDRRCTIVTAFWRRADPETRAAAVSLLARALRFREQKIRQAPVDRKVAWSLTRLGDPELARVFAEALVAYHVAEQKPLMSACLDAWGIPHESGAITAEDFAFPAPEALFATLADLAGRFPAADLELYLAASGLVMGDDRPEWRAATWPALDRLRAGAASERRSAEPTTGGG